MKSKLNLVTKNYSLFFNLSIHLQARFNSTTVAEVRSEAIGRAMIAQGFEDEEKWLAEGIAGIQHNAFFMHRALVGTLHYSPQYFLTLISQFFAILSLSQDDNNLRDALKYSAQMLSELRTSRLSPHKYYQLCK